MNASAKLEGERPIEGPVREMLVEPLIKATCSVLTEMAGGETVATSVSRKSAHRPVGDIAAVFKRRAAPQDCLVLSFPKQTADGLARQILSSSSGDLDENLIRDCVGEIANVVACQAKALLAKTPYHLDLVMPQDVVDGDEFQVPQGLDCLVVSFACEQGEFALQLYARF